MASLCFTVKKRPSFAMLCAELSCGKSVSFRFQSIDRGRANLTAPQWRLHHNDACPLSCSSLGGWFRDSLAPSDGERSKVLVEVAGEPSSPTNYASLTPRHTASRVMRWRSWTLVQEFAGDGAGSASSWPTASMDGLAGAAAL